MSQNKKKVFFMLNTLKNVLFFVLLLLFNYWKSSIFAKKQKLLWGDFFHLVSKCIQLES